jgi:hypothetical protein
VLKNKITELHTIDEDDDALKQGCQKEPEVQVTTATSPKIQETPKVKKSVFSMSQKELVEHLVVMIKKTKEKIIQKEDPDLSFNKVRLLNKALESVVVY